MFIIEGLGAKRAATWAARFQEVLGLADNQVHFMRYHQEADGAHTGDMEAILTSGMIDDADGRRDRALRAGRRPPLRAAAGRTGSLTWRSSSTPTRACGRRSTPTPPCRSTARVVRQIIDDQRRLSRRWLYPIARVLSRILVAIISDRQAHPAVPVDAAADDGFPLRLVPAALRLPRRRRPADPAFRDRDQPGQLHHPQHRRRHASPSRCGPRRCRSSASRRSSSTTSTSTTCSSRSTSCR